MSFPIIKLPYITYYLTQITGNIELMKPSMEDVLYQIEVNTFKDGLISKNDHAGVGFLATR